jgi:hypothetical protein
MIILYLIRLEELKASGHYLQVRIEQKPQICSGLQLPDGFSHRSDCEYLG